MRRDTQIGIILGVVILVVIGIFLSTRTNVYETKTPDLKLPEEIVVESEIEEIDITSPEGQKLVQKYGIMSSPGIII